MRILTRAEYEAVVRRALQIFGLSYTQAQRLLDARFPMAVQGIVGEAFGRGLSVSEADVLDAIRGLGGKHLAELQCVIEGLPCFSAEIVEDILTWLVESGRGQLTRNGRTVNEHPEWLEGLLLQWNAPSN